MFDTSELYLYYDNVIQADSNPFLISERVIYKENGEVKSKFINEEISLEEVNSFLQLILNNTQIEEVDFYPKTFFKKLFNIKSKKEIGFEGDSNFFVMMSKSTKKIFKTNCQVYNIEEDNKVIIGKRSRIVYQIKDGKLFINVNKDNFKTILIK
jgi:hypothetical protein